MARWTSWAEPASAARATPATVNLRRCKLIITKGAQRGSEFVVGGDVVRIGKATDNDLVISDETVSRNHFEIVRDGKGYLVRDLQSTNGTFLDGAEIKEAYLRAGSVVGAGAVELKFTPFEERIEILPSEREQLGRDGRSIDGDARDLRPDRADRPDRRHGLDRGRDRHRQGTWSRGPCTSCRGARTRRSWSSTAARSPGR
jgi:pSer/pThr/pTyr-binding forkhead associated (FHA) protein